MFFPTSTFLTPHQRPCANHFVKIDTSTTRQRVNRECHSLARRACKVPLTSDVAVHLDASVARWRVVLVKCLVSKDALPRPNGEGLTKVCTLSPPHAVRRMTVTSLSSAKRNEPRAISHRVRLTSARFWRVCTVSLPVVAWRLMDSFISESTDWRPWLQATTALRVRNYPIDIKQGRFSLMVQAIKGGIRLLALGRLRFGGRWRRT